MKFDVYVTYEGYNPEDPNCEDIRTIYTNGGYARTEKVNTWITLEVPLKNLYANWDTIFNHPAGNDQDYNGTEMALFSVKGFVGNTEPQEVPEPTFWIGNFSIEEPSYENETEWVWNKISADKNGAAYVCNGAANGDWGTVEYLASHAGATDVYKISTSHNWQQINGIVVKGMHIKAYYEYILAEDPNATVNVDVYWTTAELNGAGVLQTNGKYNWGVGNYAEGA